MPTANRDSLVGRVALGNYLIEAKIGRGAMGSIYRGRHQTLGRKVAVKVLRDHLVSDDDERRRFHDEAEAIARLSHPNVVTILDFGTTEQSAPCIVTEFISGETLLDILETEGPMEPWRAAKLIQQALSALIEAHAMGIVHRDIKSDNIMVQRLQDGREQVKLVDFGVSLMEGRHDPDSGFIFGTPLYMSPEQCRGERPDGRADLYSLGVVFFEILTGEPLFALDDPYDFLKAHVHQAPPLTSQIADQPIPEPVDRIIAKLLEKEPSHRYQSAQEVKQALHQWEVSRSATESGKRSDSWSRQPAPQDTQQSKATERVLDEVYERISSVAEPAPARCALVVESEEEVSRTLARALESMGLEVDRASDPIHAVERAKARDGYDIYLVAHDVAGKRGSHDVSVLISQVLSLDPLAEVLMMAGFSSVEETGADTLWQASDFLIKPFRSFRAFAGRIRAALNRREANLVQSALMRNVMRALEENASTAPLAGEIRRITESMTAGPARLVTMVSQPAESTLKKRGHRLMNAQTPDDLFRALARRGLDGVILESSQAEESLFELTSQVVSRRPDLELLIVGFASELGEMLEAVELGATDFVVKPHEDLDVLALKTELAVSRRKRRLKIRKLAKTIDSMAETTDAEPVQLQLERIRDALSETVVLEAEPPEPDHPSTPSALSSTPTVLVAEPDNMVQNLLVRSLEAIGWRCLAPPSADEALRLADQKELDWILVSATTPRWPGGQLAGRISSKNPKTGVTFVGDEQRPPSIAPHLFLGRLEKPLTGLGPISDHAAKALSRRKQLLGVAGGGSSATDRRVEGSGQGVRVLLVTPDADMASRLGEVFGEARFPALSAPSIEEAIHLLERYEVDAMVVDLDVLLVAADILLDQARSADPGMPLVAFSSAGGRDRALTALAYGARAFVAHPLSDPDGLVARIQESVTARPDQ